ncbi:hypothetical protein SMICM304S_05177 [Streptomyces microflavus]
MTFETQTDAEIWLSQVEADMTRDAWRDPDAGAVNFEEYATKWVVEGASRPSRRSCITGCSGFISFPRSARSTWTRSPRRAYGSGGRSA